DLVPPYVRGKVFGLFGTAFTLGSVIGPIVSTWIYSAFRQEILKVLGLNLPGYGIPFFVNAILGILATTIMILTVQEPDRKSESQLIPPH
ncbi:MAG: MFS transporter, partial [Candidatus Bathyarchaeota archaeon]